MAMGGNGMDGDYVFLCGVMWCGYGQQDAGRELLRATRSMDPDIRALASAMLEKGISQFKKSRLAVRAKSVSNRCADEAYSIV